jgi:hypothetical protein
MSETLRLTHKGMRGSYSPKKQRDCSFCSLINHVAFVTNVRGTLIAIVPSHGQTGPRLPLDLLGRSSSPVQEASSITLRPWERYYMVSKFSLVAAMLCMDQNLLAPRLTAVGK